MKETSPLRLPRSLEKAVKRLSAQDEHQSVRRHGGGGEGFSARNRDPLPGSESARRISRRSIGARGGVLENRPGKGMKYRCKRAEVVSQSNPSICIGERD
jgi:hypothetical protein